MQKLLPAIRSAAAHVPSEAIDGGFPYSPPCAPVKSPFESAGSVENNKHLLCQIQFYADHKVGCRQDYGWLIR